MNQRPPEDPFVVHEHDDWVFTLLRDMCLPPNLVMTSAHYLSDVKKKRPPEKRYKILRCLLCCMWTLLFLPQLSSKEISYSLENY